MRTWIALFRGINISGHNILPMAALREALVSLGCVNVRTYIQSGNAVFESAARSAASIGNKLGALIERQHGFLPRLLLLSPTELSQALAANPFPAAASDPSRLHFYFLTESAGNPNMAALAAIATPTESYELKDRVFYLHAPDGIGRSKLAANVERHLGVAVTARNHRTVQKLVTMAAH